MKLHLLRIVVIALLACLLIPVGYGQAPSQSADTLTSHLAPTKQPADAGKIEQLIRQLGSEKFAEREGASKTLTAIGKSALPALREARNNSDLEIRRRADNLIQIIMQRLFRKRAWAWTTLKSHGGKIYATKKTPDGRIGSIEFRSSKTFRDEDLALLQWLDEAKGVSLAGSSITDAGLVHLKKLRNLEILDLGSTKVTDAGMVHIEKLDRLTHLILHYTQVTDAGLSHFSKLNRLICLDVAGLPVTDAGLEHIKEVKELKWLSLANTRVTDAGLLKLNHLKKLSNLQLSATQITDAGLANLKEIKSLKILNVKKTKVTERGKAELQKSLPELIFTK